MLVIISFLCVANAALILYKLNQRKFESFEEEILDKLIEIIDVNRLDRE